MATSPDTLHTLVQTGAEQAGDEAPAIGAPGRPPLAYGALRRQLEALRATLRAAGLRQADRVALVLPNGPEMAAAFLGVAAAATAAPPNPGYRRDEFAFYLEDLGAKAVVVEADGDNAVLAAAESLGIATIPLRADPDAPAGALALDPPAIATAVDDVATQEDDVALVLHTSGTTSRPKIVPLRQRHLVASARNIAATLALRPEDRCLNVMPLFHIHGLMACVLATLGTGGCVSCTPGFNALRFFAWLESARPTWYSAVPTMHQAILARAARNPDAVAGASLRLVRSSSSSLPPQVMTALETCFDAPVVEAYAMTEAAHQMTSNPLPPGERRPGSVGRAAGPEVAIMDAAGALLPAGATGEVVIRGANVCDGYERNPDANREAWSGGWFRTGDQGVMDEAGYLRITGRLKEIINRGGEKISPREVDDVLMDHPAVQQVVTFALPHPKLGEEVASAVVLREGESVDERELRSFAAERLADFKVPRSLVFLDEIPKGPTGKLRRIGLAEQLGLA